MREYQKNARAAQQALQKCSISHAQMLQRMNLIRGITRYNSAPYQMQVTDIAYSGFGPFE
eukprot:9261842-Karenia_brevis.AAC.1